MSQRPHAAICLGPKASLDFACRCERGRSWDSVDTPTLGHTCYFACLVSLSSFGNRTCLPLRNHFPFISQPCFRLGTGPWPHAPGVDIAPGPARAPQNCPDGFNRDTGPNPARVYLPELLRELLDRGALSPSGSRATRTYAWNCSSRHCQHLGRDLPENTAKHRKAGLA